MAQICTTIEQSNRLLDAGIRPDTATMFWVRKYDWDDLFLTLAPDVYQDGHATVITPAWDLSNLIEMIPEEIEYESHAFYLFILKRDPGYIIKYSCGSMLAIQFHRESIFDAMADMIGWLIKNDSLREGWLVEKGGKE